MLFRSGQCFLFYFFWYGVGRTWIEGLRTDSLYLFGWELFGVPIRVSQLFALLTGVTAGAVLLWKMLRGGHQGKELYVERVAAREEPENKEG